MSGRRGRRECGGQVCQADNYAESRWSTFPETRLQLLVAATADAEKAGEMVGTGEFALSIFLCLIC